jgi:3-deoxy-D-manno-octulosonate 8-phosphate phosphatase (KDO 8-P phosphatase)
LNQVDLLFSESGGKFCISVQEFQQKLTRIKAFAFDWDGVFNAGIKSVQAGSTFSEPDAMGINLLRFSGWLAQRHVPKITIFSGEENKDGLYLAKREHFSSVYFKSVNKIKSFNHFVNSHGLSPEEILFVFDDVLDLSLAEVCGVRIQVSRSASPMLNHFVISHRLADYVTAHDGSNFAVREACELIMGLNGSFETTVRQRMDFNDNYRSYLAERNRTETSVYHYSNEEIKPVN